MAWSVGRYVGDGDYAVTDGDIIIGHRMQCATVAKALTIDASNRLWLRAASGIVEVPLRRKRVVPPTFRCGCRDQPCAGPVSCNGCHERTSPTT